MRRFLIVAACLLLGAVVAVALSVAFMLPPICREERPSTNACLNNLRRIEAAKEKWAEATGAERNAPVSIDGVNQYLRERTTPTCPAGGTYEYNLVRVRPRCSMEGIARASRKKQRVSVFTWRWSEGKCMPLEEPK